MSGERDLARLLAELSPSLDPVRYRFIFAGRSPDEAMRAQALMSLQEAEGWTLVLPAERVGEGAADIGPVMARLTLHVHSSLEAVGLTAAVAGALAGEGISANVVAGYFHDHLFVAEADRERALAVLQALSHRARG